MERKVYRTLDEAEAFKAWARGGRWARWWW